MSRAQLKEEAAATAKVLLKGGMDKRTTLEWLGRAIELDLITLTQIVEKVAKKCKRR